MEHAFSKGFPFEIEDVWRQSTFQLDEKEKTLFRPLKTDLPVLEFEDTPGLFKEDFHIPELGHSNGYDEQQLDEIESAAVSSITAPEDQSVDLLADVWTLDLTLNGAKPIPRLHTWEAFEKRHVTNADSIAYVSEAGPSTFDATARRLEKRAVNSSVLPQDVHLRALCNLALGRSSLFFRWDAGKKSFNRTLPDVPASGYSIASSDSLILRMIDFGSNFRILDDYGRSPASYKRTCTAITSLKGCIVKTVDSIEQHITRSIPQIRSILQLQCVTEQSHQLLEILRMFVHSVSGLSSDEEVISELSRQVHQIVAFQARLARILQILLARVSAPWLERLCVDLGLSEDRFHQRPVESESYESSGAEASSASLEQDNLVASALPDFVENDDRILMLECKQSLKALLRHLPENSPTLPQSLLVQAMISDPEDQSTPLRNASHLLMTDTPESLAWSDTETQLDYLSTLDSRMSQPLTSAEQHNDRLQAEIAVAINDDIGQVGDTALEDTVDYNPIERLRPLIREHARLINDTLLHHLFWTCRLQHNLDLQHQYHLFGNGDFAARLWTALFSPEAQSAERKRGNIPTGETMGLRLGTSDGQHWPPASSELRLTLAGVLTETYHPETPNDKTPKADIKELPGGLSFSIRELPDAEIEKVLDSGSLYALDFLRLQYIPPPGLEAVITPSSMQAYDAIFRQMLRMIRVLYVSETIKKRSRLKERLDSASFRRFSIEAHHFTSTIMSHVMHIGIQTPWRAFIASVAEVQAALMAGEECTAKRPALGLDGLRRLHEQCLESIRTRLFLRRKHEKIRNAIEEAFTAILGCAATIEKDDVDACETIYAEFEERIAELLGVLRTAVNRPGKIRADMEIAEKDTEGMSLLLERLNWNGFYRSDAK